MINHCRADHHSRALVLGDGGPVGRAWKLVWWMVSPVRESISGLPMS
jgi:hypothetical protein